MLGLVAFASVFFYTIDMIYFAHRGANTQRVQNTVAAFALAQQQGATHYELDVHLLTDGQLAIHHDYTLLQTTGHDVMLKDLSSTDLIDYPLTNRFSADKVTIPLLREVLPVISPGLELLNIELKNDGNCYPGIEKRLLSFLQDYPHLTHKILFSSFNYDTLQRLRALCPQARIGLLTRQFEVQKALDLGAESVHINHIRFTPQIADICRANQLKVYCYTVNEVQLARQLAAQGVAGIFTDDITVFRH